MTGAAASYARWSEFKRQNSFKVQRPYQASGLSYLESLNQIQLDVLDFNLLASGRLTPEEAWSRASIEGDTALAREVLNHTNVPY